MSVSRTVSEIFSVKEWRDLQTVGSNGPICNDLERPLPTVGRGRSRSLQIGPFDRPHTTLYWSAIVSIPVSGTVFELRDVEKYRDLEDWLRGH